MNALGYQPDIRITDFFKKTAFTVSAEIIPPRNGAEQEKIFRQIESLVEAGTQFLSVTKGAGGSLRGGSLPIAQAIKEKFRVPAVAHFTCRDITPHEVENQLMDHHYFGIRNILALRGDPPAGQPEWKAKEGSYSYAHELITQIKELNSGTYLTRPDDPNTSRQETTDFCIGAAAHPEHPVPSERIEFFKRKIAAGAEYGITQMIFDPDIYAEFLESAAKQNINVPVLPGTRLLKHKEQARLMADRFEVSVPKDIIDALPDKSDYNDQNKADLTKQSVELMLSMLDRFKGAGAPGVHFFVLGNTKGISEVVRNIRTAS